MKKLSVILLFALSAASILFLLNCVHNLFDRDLGPLPGYSLLSLLLLCAIPFFIKSPALFRKRGKAGFRVAPALLFAAGTFICLFAGLLQDLSGQSGLDLNFHDTYIILAHFNLPILFAIVLGLLTGLYCLLPGIFHLPLNDSLGRIHFWITFSGICILFFTTLYYEPPRLQRYLDYAGRSALHQYHWTVDLIGWTLWGVIAAQLILPAAIIYSLVRGRREAPLRIPDKGK
ncbi:MAG: cbb3-type cytochrome c oxidase subunit I [Puia sp.]|nr:cbb3-type cytochrome c oxidase subunit I [Puia sp.]